MNINDKVTVILTDYGREVLYKYRTNLEEKFKFKFKSLHNCDQNGKYVEQLWQIMHIFGSEMYVGAKQVFLNNQIYIEDTK